MLQEPHLSQGLPKAPPIPGAPHLVPTNPCSMGARHKAGGGKQLPRCPGPIWGHVSASPGGVSPGVGEATRSRDAGQAWAHWCRELRGLRGSHMAKEVEGLGVPSSRQDLDGGE